MPNSEAAEQSDGSYSLQPRQPTGCLEPTPGPDFLATCLERRFSSRGASCRYDQRLYVPHSMKQLVYHRASVQARGRPDFSPIICLSGKALGTFGAGQHCTPLPTAPILLRLFNKNRGEGRGEISVRIRGLVCLYRSCTFRCRL